MSTYRYCPYCRHELEEFTHEDRQRQRCPACQWVHYRNPAPGVAVVLIENGQLLLGRRRGGGWCIPCGYVEWGESIEEAATREFLEETGLAVELEEVVAVKSNFHNPKILTIGIWYRGRRIGGTLRPGGDLLEVEFRDLHQIEDLIFPTDRDVLELLRRDV
jgi:ADP-ribose pyrophosphatase YjhB (NUDIX family)